MEPAQFTLNPFVVPAVMLISSTVIAVIGWLLLRQMKQIDQEFANLKADVSWCKSRLHTFEIAWAAKYGQMPKKPSDVNLKVTGGDSA